MFWVLTRIHHSGTLIFCSLPVTCIFFQSPLIVAHCFTCSHDRNKVNEKGKYAIQKKAVCLALKERICSHGKLMVFSWLLVYPYTFTVVYSRDPALFHLETILTLQWVNRVSLDFLSFLGHFSWLYKCLS